MNIFIDPFISLLNEKSKTSTETERLKAQLAKQIAEYEAREKEHAARKEEFRKRVEASKAEPIRPPSEDPALVLKGAAEKQRQREALAKELEASHKLTTLWTQPYIFDNKFFKSVYNNIPGIFKDRPRDFLKLIKNWKGSFKYSKNPNFTLDSFKKAIIDILTKSGQRENIERDALFFIDEVLESGMLTPYIQKKPEARVVTEEVEVNTPEYLACVAHVVNENLKSNRIGFISRDFIKKLDRNAFTVIPDYLLQDSEIQGLFKSVDDILAARKNKVHENLNIFNAYYNILNEVRKTLPSATTPYGEPTGGGYGGGKATGIDDSAQLYAPKRQIESGYFSPNIPYEVARKKALSTIKRAQQFWQGEGYGTILPTAVVAFDILMDYYDQKKKNPTLPLLGFRGITAEEIQLGKDITKFCKETLNDPNKVTLDPVTSEDVKSENFMNYHKPLKGVHPEYSTPNTPFISYGKYADYMISLRDAFKRFGDKFKVNRIYENGEIKDKLENANLIGSSIKPYMDFIKLEKKNESTLEEEKMFNNVFKEYRDASIEKKDVPKSEFPYPVTDYFIGTKGTKPVYLKLLSSGKIQSKVFLSYSKSNHYLFIDNSKNGNLYMYRNYSGAEQDFDSESFQPYRIKVLEHQNYYYRDAETKQYDKDHPIMISRIDIEREKRSQLISNYDLKLVAFYTNVYLGDPSKAATRRYTIPNVYIFKDKSNDIFLYRTPKKIDVDQMSIPRTPGETINIKTASVAENTTLTRSDLYIKDSDKTKETTYRRWDPKYKKTRLLKRNVPVYNKIAFPKDIEKREIFNVENFGGLKDVAHGKYVKMEQLPGESIEAFKEKERKKELEKYPEPIEEKKPLTIVQRNEIYEKAKENNLVNSLKAYLKDDMDSFYTEDLKDYINLSKASKDLEKIILSYHPENLKEINEVLNKIYNKELKSKVTKFISNAIKTDKIDLLKQLILYKRKLDKLNLSQRDIDYLKERISTDEFFSKYKRENRIFDCVINKLLLEYLNDKKLKNFDMFINNFLK